MILKSDVFPIGRVIKPHGIRGELVFDFTSDVFDKEDVEYFLIEMDGILVPFYIQEYRFKGNKTGLVKFDGVSSDDQALKFAGHDIFLPKSLLEKVEGVEIGLDFFVGFTLKDKNHGILGTVSDIDQSTENVLFVLQGQHDEILIPIVKEYIEEIDYNKKVIFLDLPMGLLDL